RVPAKAIAPSPSNWLSEADGRYTISVCSSAIGESFGLSFRFWFRFTLTEDREGGMSSPGVGHRVLPEVEELRRQVAELRRELAAQALKSRESRLALIFNGVSDLLFLIGVEAGPRFRCLTVNHAYVKGTGRTREQMEGKLVEEILPPEQAQGVIEKYTAAIQ